MTEALWGMATGLHAVGEQAAGRRAVAGLRVGYEPMASGGWAVSRPASWQMGGEQAARQPGDSQAARGEERLSGERPAGPPQPGDERLLRRRSSADQRFRGERARGPASWLLSG